VYRAVVITGGPRRFAAGADVQGLLGLDPGQFDARNRVLQQAFHALATTPQITIAAVNGYALGGGCELALAADFRFAGRSAVFGLPEVTLGIMPAPAAPSGCPASSDRPGRGRADQAAGIRGCARSLAPGGTLVLTDQFSALRWPTVLLGRRRGKARTRSRATTLITAAGLRDPQWRRCYAVIIASVTAVKE